MKLVYVYVAIKGQLHPNLHDRKDPAVSEWIIVQRSTFDLRSVCRVSVAASFKYFSFF